MNVENSESVYLIYGRRIQLNTLFTQMFIISGLFSLICQH